MIKNNRPAKFSIHHGKPLFAAIGFRVALVVTVACVVAAYGGYALGSKKPRFPDKPAASKTLVAMERVDHLDRLTREPMVVELSDGTLFVSGYDNEAEKSPGLWRSRDHGATWENVNRRQQSGWRDW
jgi:hypothetical protein